MHIKENREEYLNAEGKAVRHCERLGVLGSILLQASVLYKLGSVLMCKSITKHSTEYILRSHWLIASILLIFVTVTILNYAAKWYLRQTISRKYSHNRQSEMQKNILYAETCDT